jgi:hypothetical protein
MKGNAALAALWAALDEGREPPPPDSANAYELASRRGCTKSAAQNELDRKVQAGALESGLFYIKGHKGKIRHYWLPKGKK